ncbi:TetR/AcrR family transcriptional regulator [Nocardiopsis potens]|uniref:TetR/AcrR family transcriptional regulator n=1 Tax=Nocardiopsis potens TaxID=1246458 RepID=UPI00034916FE|nr:TetR/AcrR family transcriptional regulator [Nocardiopsis potens]
MAGTRDAILGAAERVIREHGAARATTRLIAKEAGYSEATLYKHFSDKHELFLSVLTRQTPEFGRLMDRLEQRAGGAPVREVLEEVARTAIGFYTRAVPLGTSLFSEARLLQDYRARLSEWGVGPHVPVDGLAAYIAAERDRGRLRPGTDARAAAALLLGACFQQAFFSHLTDALRAADDPAADPAPALVATLLDPLLPDPAGQGRPLQDR